MDSLDADLALPHPLKPALGLALGRRAALPPLAALLLPLEARRGAGPLLEGVAREEGGLLLAEQGPRCPENGVGCGCHGRFFSLSR